jgi:D-sedoheptulose 7-phosphate isomerase
LISGDVTAGLGALLTDRTEANRRFFGAEAERLARLCHLMAERFAKGGRLIAFGRSPAARSDARHVAVEFVHPVIVGKRALPAFALTGPDLVPRARVAVRTDDILIAVAGAREADVGDLMRRVPAWGAACAWIGSGPRPAATATDHVLWIDDPDPMAPATGRFVLLYHLLWELTHVCFEHPGLLTEPTEGSGTREPQATGFLYPFIEADERDAGRLLAELATSARAKTAESAALQQSTLAASADQVAACGAAMAERFAAGGRLYAFGNGGSSTDCATFATLFASPPTGARTSSPDGPPTSSPDGARTSSPDGLPTSPPADEPASSPDGALPDFQALPALNLAADQAVVTALGNDVGFDLVFSRQIIAHAAARDIAVAFSTSGNSRDLMAALREAHGRGLLTVGLAGYDGGEMAASGDVDYCFVVHSQSIHRIQESQALLGYHLWASAQRSLQKTE